MNLGIVYHQERKYPEAVKALKAAASIDPKLLGAQVFLGIDEYLTEDHKGALEPLKKALLLQPKDREAGIYLGLDQLALNQPFQAVQALRTVTGYYPDDPEAAYHLGEAYLEAARQATAVLDKLGDRSAISHWALAISARHKHDAVSTVQDSMRALAIDPTIAPLYGDLAALLQKGGLPDLAAAARERYRLLNPEGSGSITRDDAGDSLPINEKLMAANKEAFQRLWGRIPVAHPDPSMPAVADEFVNRALAKRVNSADGAELRHALSLYIKGDYKNAAQTIAGMRHRPNDWVPAYLMTLAYARASDYGAAGEAIETRLQPYLNVPSVSLLAVEVEGRLALQYLDSVVAMQPNSYLAKLLLGKYYAAAYQNEPALAAFREALRLAPNQSGIHLAIGQVYENQLQWAPAIDEYRAELALDPANAMALAHLGHALTEAHDANDAVTVLKKLLQDNSTDGQAYADLGKALEMGGQPEDAITAYQQALRYDPSQMNLHYQLFRLYTKMGEKEEARKELVAFQAAEARKHERDQQVADALK